MLQCGHECKPDRLVLDGQLGRIALGRNEMERDGLEPGHLGGHIEVGLDRLDRRSEVHRPRTPLLALEHVEAHVGRDSVEPGAHGGAALETVAISPGPHEGVLHRILGIERRAEHPVAVSGQLAPMLLELPKGVRRRDGRALHHSDSTGRR